MKKNFEDLEEEERESVIVNGDERPDCSKHSQRRTQEETLWQVLVRRWHLVRSARKTEVCGYLHQWIACA